SEKWSLWILSVGFHFPESHPASCQVPASRNFVRQIVNPDALLEALLRHFDVFASKAEWTFVPRHFCADSLAVALHKDVVEVGKIRNRLTVLAVGAFEHFSS